MRLAALPLILGMLSPVAPAFAQEPVEANVLEEVQVVEATAIQVDGVLSRWTEAAKSRDALAIATALAEMSAYSNPEFVAPGLAGLRYRASRADKSAVRARAEELGLRGKEAIDGMLREREDAVQAAAATVLGSAPGEKNGSALRKALSDEKLRETKPAAVAAIVDALGRLDEHKAEDLVRSLLEEWGDPAISLACVRYFGQIRCKDYGHVRYLCGLLRAPAPENVDVGSNPPEDYWKQRWKVWQGMRRDVTWTLKRITGEVFLAQEGERAGETERALRYVKEHRRELELE